MLFARQEWDEGLVSKYQGLDMAASRRRHVVSEVPGFEIPEYALVGAARHLLRFNRRVAEATRGRLDLYAARTGPGTGVKGPGDLGSGDPGVEEAFDRFREGSDPATVTSLVRRAARFLGADLVGFAAFDERWLYSRLYRRHDPSDPGEWMAAEAWRPADFPAGSEEQQVPVDLPRARSVVVLAFEEDYRAINSSPAAIATAASGLGYSRMAATTSSVAEFIGRLGFWARACGNELALSIPYAIAAGLGELGRNGQLITREYGPRVRLSKVFTDAELELDSPITFGVAEFCRVCRKCAEYCPSRAISFDREPTWSGPSRSNNSGVHKWYIDPEKCLLFWKQNGGGCSTCHSRCPYNKDYSHWYHRLARDLVSWLPAKLSGHFLWLEEMLGFGRRVPASDWWRS
jgi:reductive dehalogenase